MKYLLGILLVFLFITPLKPQDATGWKNYTDMKSVQSLAASGSDVWGATSGGGFDYNTANNTFATFHKAEGMNGIDITAVTVDTSGKIWFGSAEGIIDVYNPADRSFHSILDIYNSNKNSKRINYLETSGDTILVSTDFGISLIDPNNLVFYDTFFKFGSFPSNSPVNSTVKQNLIYAATESGVAVQKPGENNLSAPEAWSVYTKADGLPSISVNKISVYNGKIIAATSSGLAEFNGTSWTSFLPQFNSNNVDDIISKSDTLFILSDNVVSAYASGSVSNIYSATVPVTKLAYSGTAGLIAAGTSGMVIIGKSAGQEILAPNGPASDQFPSMTVDNDGNLWCASGRDVTGKGFYEFDGKKWTNYNSTNFPQLVNNAFHTVYVSPENKIYFGNWGNGFVRIADSTIDLFNTQNSGMLGIPVNPQFLVVTGFANDSKNNLWVLNYGGVDRKPLNVLTPDSVWYHIPVSGTANLTLNSMTNLVIDQFDTKWFSTVDPTRPGIFYFNGNKTFDNTSDDISGYINSSDGINTNTITCMAVDLRGDIWVGTSLGVNIITNTQSVLSPGSSQLSISNVFTLRQQSINCMAVDPLNRKWIGTNQGLLLVNSDGTSLLASYNSSNSPLLGDIITSIAVDKNTGTVYAATDQGLTSFQTSAIQPQDSFTKLVMYPSPFALNSGSNRLTISGLIRDSEIKVLSVTGRLIKEFSSPGGRVAYWDGTDTQGNLVNSGVYIIVAYDKDGNNVLTGKIAVLRQ